MLHTDTRYSDEEKKEAFVKNFYEQDLKHFVPGSYNMTKTLSLRSIPLHQCSPYQHANFLTGINCYLLLYTKFRYSYFLYFWHDLWHIRNLFNRSKYSRERAIICRYPGYKCEELQFDVLFYGYGLTTRHCLDTVQ